jgi:hypothetical protein
VFCKLILKIFLVMFNLNFFINVYTFAMTNGIKYHEIKVVIVSKETQKVENRSKIIPLFSCRNQIYNKTK